MSDRDPTGRSPEDPVPARVLGAWPAQEPPPGFADRVLAAWQPAPEPRWRRAWLVPVLVPALAAVAAVVLPVGLPSSGTRTAVAQEEVRLGRRGVLVTQPGAELAWTVGVLGDVEVEQTRGHAFYRVEPGGDFRVRTPAGTVDVQGTCFDVEVEAMQGRKTWQAPAAGFVAGVLSAVVVVTVYQGKVVLAQDGSQVSLGAGERGRAGAGVAPVKLATADLPRLEQQNARLRAREKDLQLEVEDLQARLALVRQAQARGEDPVKAENQSLRADLERARRLLEEEKGLRREQEGAPLPFPADLPERYRQAGLMASFQEALRAAGVPGDVTAMDCSEFPCVVYGEVKTGGARPEMEAGFRRFEEALRQRYPDGTDSMHTSLWTSSKEGEGPRNTFGIAVYPTGAGGLERGDISKRLRFRQTQYVESQVGR